MELETDVKSQLKEAVNDDNGEGDPFRVAKSEILPDHNSIEDIVDKLEDVITFVKDRYENHLQCLLLYDSDQKPFLSVVSYNPDQFLIDRDAVTANVIVDEDFKISAKLVTLNREVILEVSAEIGLEPIIPVLEDLQQGRFRACVGYRESHFTELLPRMRKSDFLQLSVGRFDGETIYRSKFCSFVVDIDYLEPQCVECGKFYNGLSGTAPAAEETKDLPETSEVGGEKRKRGRPKGSKNKSFAPNSSDVFQDLVDGASNVEIKTETTDYEEPVQQVKEESDEDSTAMVDDSKDEDYRVRRGLRKRITTSRQKALLALSKRKRGRPPTIAGPFDCNACDLKFTMLRDYRKHYLEHTNSFACDFENCEFRALWRT